MKSEHGFTLIELLLVLAIIGIISAVAIPALLGQRERAKKTAVQGLGDTASSELSSAIALMTVGSVVPSASAVIAKVLLVSNIAKARNPYGGTALPFVQGQTGAYGQVALEAVSNRTDPITGQPCQAILVHTIWKEGSTTRSTVKVVAVD